MGDPGSLTCTASLLTSSVGVCPNLAGRISITTCSLPAAEAHTDGSQMARRAAGTRRAQATSESTSCCHCWQPLAEAESAWRSLALMASPEKSTGDSVRVTRWRPAAKGSTPMPVSDHVQHSGMS